VKKLDQHITLTRPCAQQRPDIGECTIVQSTAFGAAIPAPTFLKSHAFTPWLHLSPNAVDEVIERRL
jgi:hypothetical protein